MMASKKNTLVETNPEHGINGVMDAIKSAEETLIKPSPYLSSRTAGIRDKFFSQKTREIENRPLPKETAGSNYIILDGTARTHSENTNELVRARAAYHLGLFVDPNNPNRHIPSEDLKNDIGNAASSAYSISKGSSNE